MPVWECYRFSSGQISIRCRFMAKKYRGIQTGCPGFFSAVLFFLGLFGLCRLLIGFRMGVLIRLILFLILIHFRILQLFFLAEFFPQAYLARIWQDYSLLQKNAPGKISFQVHFILK